MGRIAKVVSTEINDDDNVILTVEYEYGHNIQVPLFTPAGDNSYPLEADRVSLVDVDGTGNYIAVGNLTVDQGMDEGDKIIYSRDTDGNTVAKSHYKNDGTVEHTTDSNIITNVSEDAVIQEFNDDGTVNLTCDDTITHETGGDYDVLADGDANINPDGEVVLKDGSDYAVRYNELKTQLDQLKLDFNTHTHNTSGVQAGGSTIASAVPTVTSSVSFTNTKVSKVRVPTFAEESA